MKTHNAFIFHCRYCGNVVHSERKLRGPECCAREMVIAAAETIFDREAVSEEPAGENIE
jgi:hypothetical protein